MLAFGACLAGCANYTQPIVSPGPQTPAEQNFEAVWQASLELLREYYFTADPLQGGMQDRRTGLIRSAPMIAQYWFEFWRKDAANYSDWAEGSVQKIYRQVTIRIKPSPADPTQFVATVETQTFRSDKTMRWQAHDSLSIYGMFMVPGQEVGMHQLLLNEPTEEQGAMIVSLGRDRALEDKMATELAKITAKQQVGER